MASPLYVRRAALAFTTAITAAVIAACAMIGFGAPPHPAAAPPATGTEAHDIWQAALQQKGLRIVVSIDARRVWLLQGADTILSAPVAVGRGSTFSYGGKTFHFKTPRGRRTVIAKETDPLWVPPDWHYLEKAAKRGLKVVHLERGKKYRLRDGTSIEIRGDEVGRVNKFKNFWPFTPGSEIIFYDTIFIPPLDTKQRRVPDALGPYKLDLGDGYLIHGTHRYNRDSIGQAVSHGCIRMHNDDVARLYEMVPVGTPVFIY